MARRAVRAPTTKGEAEIVIRAATAADVPGVIALDEEVTGLLKADYWRDMFERYGARRRESRFFLVAVAAGRIDGFIIGEVLLRSRSHPEPTSVTSSSRRTRGPTSTTPMSGCSWIVGCTAR